MRVLVASDAIGDLDARRAADIIGGAFHAEGAQVAAVVLAPDAPTPDDQSELARAVRDGARVVDLTRLVVDDLGAAFLDGFGATPADALGQLRELLAGRGLRVVVDTDDVELPLTGLSGMAVTRSRESGGELAEGLQADARAQRWLTGLGLDDGPGAGAAGGLGAVLQACGARLLDRLDLAIEDSGLARTAAMADVIVTGCTDLDFHAKGGALVARVVRVGEEALRPVIVLSRRNFVSSRELRQAGIEAAYAIHAGADELPVTEASLAELAGQVARTWRF